MILSIFCTFSDILYVISPENTKFNCILCFSAFPPSLPCVKILLFPLNMQEKYSIMATSEICLKIVKQSTCFISKPFDEMCIRDRWKPWLPSQRPSWKSLPSRLQLQLTLSCSLIYSSCFFLYWASTCHEAWTAKTAILLLQKPLITYLTFIYIYTCFVKLF